MTTPIPVREPRIDKQFVPNTAVKDQAATALWFEYTYALCSTDPNAGGEIVMKNVALFAVDKMLFLRHSQAEIEVPLHQAAKFQATDVQSNFRSVDKSGIGRPITADEAFLTVLRAWEFATQRPQVSYVDSPVPNPAIPHITVGAHWLVSEPLQWPVTSKDLELIRKGDETAAKRVMKQAEAFWLETASERPFPDDTPAHRFSRGPAIELDTALLVGRMAGKLLEMAPTDFPEYQPVMSAATAGLAPELVKAAEAETNWT